MGLRARHYTSQGGPHNDYQEFRDKVVHLKPQVIVHINGFYFPCPTVNQMILTKDVIDHVGKKSASGFSVNIISKGTSVNQHCDFASQVEREGSLCTKHIVPFNKVWGKHFISGLTPYFHPAGPLDSYIQDKIESEEVISTDGGGWQCNKNCCLLPENMRTSYPGPKKGYTR